jgi:hypothetical protein
MEEGSKVTYQQFVDNLEEGTVKSADLYSYGSTDLTYVMEDGQLRLVDRPGKASEDELLINALKGGEVAYTLHDEAYPTKDENDYNIGWISTLMFAIPLALVVVIVIQAIIIYRLSERKHTS